MSKYNYIAMIPARMGSRRVVKKNIRYMLDKPLINYPIDLAKSESRFNSIWVNTESVALGKYCETLGVNFHKRPAELSNDVATNRDFVYEFLNKHECDYVIMINPTSPTVREETLSKFLDYVDEGTYDTVMTTTQIKAECMMSNKNLNFDKKDKIPSEKLTPIEYITWAFTAWKRDTFINLQETGECPVFGGNLSTFCIPKDESHDIDNEEDWIVAEAMLRARRSKEYEKRYLEI